MKAYWALFLVVAWSACAQADGRRLTGLYHFVDERGERLGTNGIRIRIDASGLELRHTYTHQGVTDQPGHYYGLSGPTDGTVVATHYAHRDGGQPFVGWVGKNWLRINLLSGGEHLEILERSEAYDIPHSAFEDGFRGRLSRGISNLSFRLGSRTMYDISRWMRESHEQQSKRIYEATRATATNVRQRHIRTLFSLEPGGLVRVRVDGSRNTRWFFWDEAAVALSYGSEFQEYLLKRVGDAQ